MKVYFCENLSIFTRTGNYFFVFFVLSFNEVGRCQFYCKLPVENNSCESSKTLKPIISLGNQVDPENVI